MPSIVWTSYDKGKDEVKCKLCGHKQKSQKGTSTTNLSRHIQSRHPIEYATELEKVKNPGKRNFNNEKSISASPCSSTSAIASTSESETENKKQKLDDSRTETKTKQMTWLTIFQI